MLNPESVLYGDGLWVLPILKCVFFTHKDINEVFGQNAHLLLSLTVHKTQMSCQIRPAVKM